MKYINESLPKEQRLGQVGVNIQGEKMTIIRYGGAIDIDVQFEDGSINKNKRYGNFRMGGITHPTKYEETIAYYIEVELKLNLDDVWNWEKNNENGINPYEITKQSNKKIWLYCLEHDYHNYDRNGNRIGYGIACHSFYRGSRCGYCNTFASGKVHWKDSLAYNYPSVAKMIAIPKNDLTFDDTFEIACRSNRKFYIECQDCKIISDKKYSLNVITKYGYSCKICSDGLSLPEKFMANILKQLNIDFQTQLTKTDFNWCNEFKYDFYIYNFGIIETHGMQHYKEVKSWKITLSQTQENDKLKKELGIKYVDNYIVIDCRYSTLKWLKENVIKELSSYFDLSKVDWELAWEESQKSECAETWEIYNNITHDIVEISRMLNVSRNTIRIYLKRGAEIGKCDYTIEESLKIKAEKNSGKNNGRSTKVICITTKKIFHSKEEGAECYKLNKGTHINDCCRGYRIQNDKKIKVKSCGKLPDGTPLVWRYININHNKILRGKDIIKLHSINHDKVA